MTFQEAKEMYETDFELSHEDALERIYDMLDECDSKNIGEDADDILLKYLDNVDQVKELGKRQMLTIQSIHDELEHLLEQSK